MVHGGVEFEVVKAAKKRTPVYRKTARERVSESLPPNHPEPQACRLTQEGIDEGYDGDWMDVVADVLCGREHNVEVVAGVTLEDRAALRQRRRTHGDPQDPQDG